MKLSIVVVMFVLTSCHTKTDTKQSPCLTCAKTECATSYVPCKQTDKCDEAVSCFMECTTKPTDIAAKSCMIDCIDNSTDEAVHASRVFLECFINSCEASCQ